MAACFSGTGGRGPSGRPEVGAAVPARLDRAIQHTSSVNAALGGPLTSKGTLVTFPNRTEHGRRGTEPQTARPGGGWAPWAPRRDLGLSECSGPRGPRGDSACHGGAGDCQGAARRGHGGGQRGL